jgi:hypothetical protein
MSPSVNVHSTKKERISAPGAQVSETNPMQGGPARFGRTIAKTRAHARETRHIPLMRPALRGCGVHSLHPPGIPDSVRLRSGPNPGLQAPSTTGACPLRPARSRWHRTGAQPNFVLTAF